MRPIIGCNTHVQSNNAKSSEAGVMDYMFFFTNKNVNSIFIALLYCKADKGSRTDPKF
jgi:hypothetical protein